MSADINDMARAIGLTVALSRFEASAKGKAYPDEAILIEAIRTGNKSRISHEGDGELLAEMLTEDPDRLVRLIEMASKTPAPEGAAIYLQVILNHWRGEGQWPTKLEARTKASTLMNKAGLTPWGATDSTQWRRVEKRFGIDYLLDSDG